MSDMSGGGRGFLTGVVTIKRADTGREETYQLRMDVGGYGQPTEEQAQQAVEAFNSPKPEGEPS